MKIYSTYSVKIKHYNHIFKDTIKLYRSAVDFFINVCLEEWEDISKIDYKQEQQSYIEHLCHKTKLNPSIKYNFDKKFYKFPSYLRRGAINEAIGKVSSYKSNLNNWEDTDKSTKKPSYPKAGYVYPCMYKTEMYKEIDTYKAKIKVYIRNTWDWIEIELRKSDIDYITKYCSTKKKCAPTLQKRGKEWFLDFPFEEQTSLNKKDIFEQIILSVDLGINNAATVSVIKSDGTIIGRYFYKLTKEYDCLEHAINRIKKAQQKGNKKTPRLWAKAKGINNNIAVKTAKFIMDVAITNKVDVIVFEHLDLNGKKHGSKKQKLHMWRSQYVQSMINDKAHRAHIRTSHICAWGTSKLAYDGSGIVKRGEEAKLNSYSICKFSSGKIYNCDLSASYNIGSRYFIREILKSLSAREELALQAKVPEVTKRSTCTLSTLINLNAELKSIAI